MASLTDRAPSRLMAALFKAPARLFRWRLGWVFRGRLLVLHHTGRHSGRERAAVLEVVLHEPDPPTWYVAAAWGEQSDWFRNLQAEPRAALTAGRRRYRVTARVAAPEEAARLHARYVRAHPWAARVIGRLIGVDLVGEDPEVLAARIPLVVLQAAGEGG